MGGSQVNLTVQMAVVLVPVAVYFLLLGLFNSRRTPQLVNGRTDFILLIAAFFPAFCVPLLNYLGASPWAVLGLGAALVATVLLAPARRNNWVIYNISLPEAVRAIERALQACGQPFTRHGRLIVLTASDVKIRLMAIPMLRNVSVSASGSDSESVGRKLETRLGEQLSTLTAVTAPMAMAFLLLATAMLVAPVGMFANQMPEMVRMLSDLVK